MKAKIKPRINLENRTPLQNIIPLSTPMILFVDPSSLCTFKCKFCPSGNRDMVRYRYNGIMSLNIYKKIIDDLKEFDKPLDILRMYKEGEPLLNKNFSQMVRYAKDSNYINYIDTTTNGHLLNEELNKEILDAGLDRINISVNGMSEQQFLKYSRIKIDFDQYVKNIKQLYNIRENNGYKCEICIKIIGDFLNENEKNSFYNIFGDYADRIFIENLAPCWPEFDLENNIDMKINKERGIYNQSLGSEVNICPYIFYMTTVNSDGTISLCFLDWAHKLIIGDLKKQTLKEVWNSEILYKYQMNNLKGKRKFIEVCKNCGQLKYCLPDNIDPYASKLKERL